MGNQYFQYPYYFAAAKGKCLSKDQLYIFFFFSVGYHAQSNLPSLLLEYNHTRLVKYPFYFDGSWECFLDTQQ